MLKIGAVLLSIAMLGLVTVEDAPVCQKGHAALMAFAEAIENEDAFAVHFYMQTARCLWFRPDISATVLEEGDGWIKVLLKPQDSPSVEVYTIPEGVK